MFKEQRTDKVLEIIRERKYVNVETLVSLLHYSPATIRRDITYLANLGLVRKSYGGVSVINAKPVIVREHDNIAEKVRICKRASELIKDGDYIFIDGTTTTYFLGEMLLNKKDITVVTTNLKLAIFLGEHKINCYVCSGKVCDSVFLCGEFVPDLINKMNFDVVFFSVGAIDEEGRFSINNAFWDFMKTAISRSKKSVLLCDRKKLENLARTFVSTIGIFDCVLSDCDLPLTIKEKNPQVEFIVAD